MDWIRTIKTLPRRVMLSVAVGLLGSLLLLSPAHAAEDYAIFSLDSGFEEISI